MEGICHRCERTLKGGDKVKLLVHSEWVPLRSKVTFSIDRPFDCDPETLEHITCPS